MSSIEQDLNDAEQRDEQQLSTLNDNRDQQLEEEAKPEGEEAPKEENEKKKENKEEEEEKPADEGQKQEDDVKEEKSEEQEKDKPAEEDQPADDTPEEKNEDEETYQALEDPNSGGGDNLNPLRTMSVSQMRDSPTSLPEERVKHALKDPLQKEHTCPQCVEVMRYPIKFDECGHRVCAACFHEYFKVEPRCPVDQSVVNREKAVLDKDLTREIMKLEVTCCHNEWGCKWTGTLGDGQAHVEKCEFEDVLCINDCGTKFQRRFQQKHLDKDCPKKIISCAFCDERCLREEKKAHLEECMKVPLPCPNKCDKKLTIARDDLEKHIEDDCPRTKILCQFDEIGCPHRCSRERLQKHNKTGIISHVRLLYDVIMKQGQRLDQHHELLQDHGALLEAHQGQIAEMQRAARTQLIWRVDEFSRKMKEAKSGNVTTLFSPPFQTSKHGYRMCASLCLNGDGKGKGTYVSVFVSILRGAFDPLLKWPFSSRVTFYLLDQNSDMEQRKHIKFSVKPNPIDENLPFLGCPKMEKNASFGGSKFCKQSEFEDSPTLAKDDVIYIKISCECDEGTDG